MNKVKLLKTEHYEWLVASVADRAQKDFKRIYLDRAGGARRIKTTKDQAWIKRHGTDQVDIAALDYRELPLDWLWERKIGAQIATDAVMDATRNGNKLDNNFIEKVAELLHEKWLERNRARATETELHSYAELPENEKEKDRFFVRAAVELCEKLGKSTPPAGCATKMSGRGHRNPASWKPENRK